MVRYHHPVFRSLVPFRRDSLALTQIHFRRYLISFYLFGLERIFKERKSKK